MGKVQEALAEYFESQSSWRGTKTEEYPDDYRNENCALSLAALAEEARKLPDDHPLVVAVKNQLVVTDVIMPSEGQWHIAVSRYGFDPHADMQVSPSDFLVELAGLWEDDEDIQAAEEAEELAISAELDAEEDKEEEELDRLAEATGDE